MRNYGFNNTVSSDEAEALKEMIFRRVRERSQALTQEVHADHTKKFQYEVMDLARDSFSSNKNPFAAKNELPENNKEEIVETKTEIPEEIEQAKLQINEIKTQIYHKNKTISYDIANKEVQLTMNNARAELEKKQHFVGALDFLNSQATISLVKKQGKRFEALT